MAKITIELVTNNNIEQCRDLCNQLMAFQKSKATIHKELFDEMTFDTRMKPSYNSALEKHVVVVKDNNIPVGYVFSTINLIEKDASNIFPCWAPKNENTIGFYPAWLELPQKIGCLNNLYLRDEYKGLGLGKKMFDQAMQWLGSFSDCNLAFVYISNGNDAAYKFYLKNGFIHSHEVFGGFIKAAYYKFDIPAF